MSIVTGYRLADNSRQLRRLFDERVRGLGITGPQARLLLSLERVPDENQAFYAERLEIEDERDQEKNQEVEKDRDIDRDPGLSH